MLRTPATRRSNFDILAETGSHTKSVGTRGWRAGGGRPTIPGPDENVFSFSPIGRTAMTLRITVPEGADLLAHVWGRMVPGIGPAAAGLSMAVYEHSTLELRTFEAARLRIAAINDCRWCRDFRTERDGERVEDAFPAAVAAWRDAPDALDARALLAAEYAERFALAHTDLDEDFWERAHALFSDAELVELTMCLGSWVAFGRLNRVLGLDTVCALPQHP